MIRFETTTHTTRFLEAWRSRLPFAGGQPPLGVAFLLPYQVLLILSGRAWGAGTDE